MKRGKPWMTPGRRGFLKWLGTVITTVVVERVIDGGLGRLLSPSVPRNVVVTPPPATLTTSSAPPKFGEAAAVAVGESVALAEAVVVKVVPSAGSGSISEPAAPS